MKRLVVFLACVFLGASICLAQEIVNDEALFAQYKEFNHKYFSNELPVEHVTIAFDASVPKWQMAGTWITHYEGEPEKIKMGISFFAKDCESCASMAMLHEMAHILLRHQKIKDIHGKEFQAVMLNLVKKGAFNPYW